MSNACRSRNAFVGIFMVLGEPHVVCRWKAKRRLFWGAVLNLKPCARQCPRNFMIYILYVISS